MKINNFRVDLTDISAKKEALIATDLCVITRKLAQVCASPAKLIVNSLCNLLGIVCVDLQEQIFIQSFCTARRYLHQALLFQISASFFKIK